MAIEADLWLLPASAIADVVAAAQPCKAGWFGKREDRFYKTLRARARTIAYFEWWGYSLLMCLQFLHDCRDIDLLCYMETDVADAIHEARGTLCLALSPEDAKKIYGSLLDVELDESELRDFYNEFNEGDDPASGKAMLAAFDAIIRWLDEVREGDLGLILMG